MKEIFICILAFLAVVLPAVYFYALPEKEDAKTPGGGPKQDEVPLLLRLLRSAARMLDSSGLGDVFRKMFRGHTVHLEEKLHLSGLDITPGELYCSQFLMLVMTAAAAAIVAGLVSDAEHMASVPVAGAIGMLIGWSLPEVAVGNLAQKRQTQILQAIPYAIDLIASAMRGGLDFGAAIRFYVKLGLKGPLTDEFSQMLREMELGVTRIRALQNMAERVKIKQFTSFVSAIELGTELGAPLTDTMEIQAAEMRKARFALAECKAQKAPSIMLLPMALFILPAVFIIILTPVFLKMKESGVPLF